MFKMGCSMAKKILAIDGKDRNAIGGEASTSGSGSTKKGGKDKQHQQQQHQQTSQETSSVMKTKINPDELGDFSKLEQDPRIPLNVRQIFKITKSWKAIARTMSKTGTAMFLNLFEQNQDLFYLFDRFQHLKGKELHDSMELREHASTVMSTLDQSINSLSDYDNFVTYLHSIGELHRKVPGFKREHFWKIEQPFLKAVKQTLDERCNETIEEIYKIAIKLIIETIADGYGQDDEQLASGGSSKERESAPGAGGASGGGGTSGAGNSNSNSNSNSNGNGNGSLTKDAEDKDTNDVIGFAKTGKQTNTSGSSKKQESTHHNEQQHQQQSQPPTNTNGGGCPYKNNSKGGVGTTAWACPVLKASDRHEVVIHSTGLSATAAT